MKAYEYLISYLETETDFYNNDKVDGFGIMKSENFTSVMEQFANQRVIDELEKLLKLELEIEGVYMDYEAVSVYDIQNRIEELNKLKNKI